MVKFGLIERWTPEPGMVTSWRPTAAAVSAALGAPVVDVPPSHIQHAYLEDSYRAREHYRQLGSDVRPSRLAVISFDIEGVLDPAAMTRAINAFVVRHDTFHSWFTPGESGPVRQVVDPAEIELEIWTRTDLDSSDAVRELVEAATPGPEVWECFTFGTIERAGGFTVYAAADHLVTDGISQALTIFDLRQLYETACVGEPEAAFAAGSYLGFCRNERARTAELTRESPTVQRWTEIIRDNGGHLPEFPLPLRGGVEGPVRTDDAQFPMLDPQQATAFDEACAKVGARFSGGLFAAAALAQYELTGRSAYVGMAPTSTRSSPEEWASVGWFASLVPVAFDVDGVQSFSELLVRAQEGFVASKALGDTSYHRVLELMGPADGLLTEPGWSAPMISYVDVRKLPGADELAAANVGLFANRGNSEEVYLWVNRFADHTSATFLYPGTEVGRQSVTTWFERVREIFQTVAADGDRAIRHPEAA